MVLKSQSLFKDTPQENYYSLESMMKKFKAYKIITTKNFAEKKESF